MGSGSSKTAAKVVPSSSVNEERTIKTVNKMDNGSNARTPGKQNQVIEIKDIEKLNNSTEYQRSQSVKDSESKESENPITSNEKSQNDKIETQNDDNENEDEGSEGEEETEDKKDGPVLTPEEKHAKRIEELRAKIELVEALGPDNNIDAETGYYNLAIRQLVTKSYNVYFKLKKTSLETSINQKLEISKILLDKNTVELWCDVVINSYHKEWKNEEGKTIVPVYNPFKFALLSIHNYTDASGQIAIRATNHPGFLEILKQILLDNCEANINGTQDDRHVKVTKWCCSTIHNVSMEESNVSRLRSLDFTAVLQPYLQTKLKMFKLNIFASLAAIVDEKESEIIHANKSTIEFLLKVLSKGMDTKIRRHNGWSCKECGLTVRMLARNDANKKLLVELGALELLVKLGKTGNQNEQYESVGAIWALSFDEENRQKIVDPDLGAVDLLLELKQAPDARIKKTCNGALWTLRNELQSSEKYKEIGQRQESLAGQARAKSARRRNERGDGEEDQGHIMISYQWADQQLLIKIRDRLKSAGHKVWMDIDQMGGSTLQSMADAVENANIVLMCMSQKYKNSPNCRAEAEYAFQKQKKIVPLKTERGYMPDGWLGFICGAKLFYEFSNKYPFEDKMLALLKELATISGQQLKALEIHPEPTTRAHQPPAIVSSKEMVHSAPVNQPVTMTTKIPKEKVKTVREWTNDDVQKWIVQHNLKSCGLDRATGGEIALLIKLCIESPDFFYKCLQDMFKVKDFLTLSKIVWAVTDLGES